MTELNAWCTPEQTPKMRLHQLVAKRKAKVLRGGGVIILLTIRQRHRMPLPIKGTWLCTCEGVDCGDIALLPSSSCCHRDGVLSPRVELCQGDGGNIFGHCQLKQKLNVVRLWTDSINANCMFFNIVPTSRFYLSGGARRGCAGDLIMVDGTLDHTPHECDGFVCRSCHGEIHGHVQPYENGRTDWCSRVQL